MFSFKKTQAEKDKIVYFPKLCSELHIMQNICKIINFSLYKYYNIAENICQERLNYYFFLSLIARRLRQIKLLQISPLFYALILDIYWQSLKYKL